MRQSTTLFVQIVKKIPNAMIQNAIESFGSDHRARTFRARDHLYVLLLGHLRGVESLRHLVSLWEDLPGIRTALGVGRVARSTLADANHSRRHEFFRALMAQVLNHCHEAAGKPKRGLKRLRFALDSTSIELAADLFDWARVSSDRSAIKIHTLLRTDVALPEVLHIGDGATHDVKRAKGLPIPPGSIVSMDRAYVDAQFFVALHDQGTLFVTRMKRGMKYRTVKRRKIPKGAKEIRFDHEIALTGAGAKTYGDRPLRCIRYIDPETGRSLIFLTNSMDLAARTIAQLYRERWQVELFFKWIKQNLKIRSFWGRSRNAVLVQLWMAMLAYALIAWINLTIHKSWRRLRTLRFIQDHLLQPCSPSFWEPDAQAAK